MIIVADHTLSFYDLDGAWRWDLVDSGKDCATVKSGHLDRSALESIVQRESVSVEEAVTILSFESTGIGSCSRCNMLKADIQISCWHFGLLVAFTYELNLEAGIHTCLDTDLNRGLLGLDGPAVEAKNLLIVSDGLARTIVHFFESHIDGDIDVLGACWSWLVEASVSSTEVTALDLEISADDVSEVSAEIVEWV